jgi:hypothetical protein
MQNASVRAYGSQAVPVSAATPLLIQLLMTGVVMRKGNLS